jgi:serine/threonine protein kinase
VNVDLVQGPEPSGGGTADPRELELVAGAMLDARYRILRLVGRGGMGRVYEALHIGLERRVAIKTVGRCRAGEFYARFSREIRAVSRLNHPNVVAALDCGYLPANEPYLVMEFLDGGSVRELLRREGQLPASRAVRLAMDACKGLQAAHECGVLHRDIKPENLFVARRGSQPETCVVLDFGLAKFSQNSPVDMLTQAGVPFGTLQYMSPEQARGDFDVDSRADVYSCAAVLYEMLTGRRVHAAESPHALLHKVTHEDPAPLTGLLPAGLDAVVIRGLSRDREKRPVSAAEFSRMLAPFARRCDEGSAGDVELRTAGTHSPTLPDPGSTRLPEPALVRGSRWAGIAALAVTAIGIYAMTRVTVPRSEGGVSDKYLARLAPTVWPRVTQPSAPSTKVSRVDAPSLPPVKAGAATRSVIRPAPVEAPRLVVGSRIVTGRTPERFDRGNPYDD